MRPATAVAPAAIRPFVDGEKLKEAARYLDSARKALLAFTRDTCANTDNLDPHADHIEDVLGWARQVQEAGVKVQFKARLFGASQ